jgi:hypothetical protein
MCNFSAGFVVGTVMGAALIVAVHPMNKRSMKKAYHRAGRMVNRVGHTLRELT